MVRKLLAAFAVLVVVIAAGVACRRSASVQAIGVSTGQPPAPVYLCDGVTSSCNFLGGSSNPVVSDPVPAGLNNAWADLTTAGVQLTVKGAAGTFVGCQLCNEGTATGWWMCYDQALPDAGGVAGTAGLWLGERVPPGGCQPFNLGGRAFTKGLQCYSSSTVSTLTTGSAPNFTASCAAR